MKSDHYYQQNWRPIYELSSAALWFSAMNVAYTLSFFSSLPLIGFVLTSSFCAAMMITRLTQALPRWQQHRRLKVKKLVLLKLTQKQCSALQNKNQEQGVWLGWGFEWQRLHGQRAWDLLRSDNLPAKSEKTMGAGWIHGMEEHEESLYQPLEQIQMHTMVIGVPGSGKTRLFDLLVTQAVLRNESVIIIDPKGDHDLASHTLRSCELAGNKYRFMKFHPGFPADSIRINLLQNFNRSSELASRISGLMPSGGDNAPFQAFAQAGSLLKFQPVALIVLLQQGIIAEYEREKILERSRRGKRHKAQCGSINVLGGAPYGYCYIGKNDGAGTARYEIQEQEAEVVRQIFTWIGRERWSIGDVKRHLDKEQIPSPKGKAWWDRTTLRALLKNPAYQGKAAFGKTRVGSLRPRLRPQKGGSLQPKDSHSVYDVPQDQWLFIPVPALVSDELFEAVQVQLEENRRHARTGKRGARYLLQGLISCSCCGYAYYGKAISPSARKGHKRDYEYYRCIGSDAYRFGGHRLCSNTQIRTDRLEEAVWSSVCDLIKDPQMLCTEYQRRLSSLQSPNQDSGLKTAEKQIATLSNSVARLIDGYAAYSGNT